MCEAGIVVNDNTHSHIFCFGIYSEFSFQRKKKKLFFFFFTKLTIAAQRHLSYLRSFCFNYSRKISKEIIARRKLVWLFTVCCGSTQDCEGVKKQQATV